MILSVVYLTADFSIASILGQGLIFFNFIACYCLIKTPALWLLATLIYIVTPNKQWA